jgi:hypothetical protein
MWKSLELQHQELSYLVLKLSASYYATYGVFSFIDTDMSGPVLKSIRLLVRMGSYRLIVGPGRNHFLRTRPFLTWFVVELGSAKWYWNDMNCFFTADRSVPN